MRLAGAALALVAALALGDVVLKDEGVVLGPVLSLNCVGALACTRDGGAGILDGGP